MHYQPDQLIGRQVCAVVNFPPRQIGPFISEVLTLGMPDDGRRGRAGHARLQGAERRAAVLMATHYYTVTWDQLHRDARALAWRLIEKAPFTGIVAITRGGLIPAAIVARELECRLVESVSVMTYDEEAHGRTPVVTKPPARPATAPAS